MATPRDIINTSLRLIGALATGETAQASDVNDGLSALNDLLESWSNEELILPFRTREEFTLVASQSSYTFGSGGDFDSTRPMAIESVLFQESSSPQYEIPLQCLSPKEFAMLTDKTTSSTIPLNYYLEGTNPLETIKFYPVPSAAKNIVIYSWKPLTTFSSLSTTLTFPPGYNRALKFNLALEIAPEYGKTPSADIYRIANEAKANIKRTNMVPVYLDMDPEIVGPRSSGSYNIITGES